MIKLIATDMDGTLLDKEHEVPKDFDYVIEKLKDKGILFAIATGRSYSSIMSKLKDYEDDLIFICENGTSIYYKGECIYSKPLKKSTIAKLTSIGKNIKDAYPMLSGAKSVYIEDDKLFDLFDKHFPVNGDIVVVDSFLEVEDDIYKVNMFDLKDAGKNSYSVFKEHQLEDVQLTPSGTYWLDMFDINTNKGTAINIIQDMFNIKYEETMSFGDYLNDIEMIQNSYYGYVMKNAHEELKKVGKFETKYSNEEHGVTKTIREVVLCEDIKEDIQYNN